MSICYVKWVKLKCTSSFEIHSTSIMSMEDLTLIFYTGVVFTWNLFRLCRRFRSSALSKTNNCLKIHFVRDFVSLMHLKHIMLPNVYWLNGNQIKLFLINIVLCVYRVRVFYPYKQIRLGYSIWNTYTLLCGRLDLILYTMLGLHISNGVTVSNLWLN